MILRHLILTALAASLTIPSLFAQYTPRKDYAWARDVSVAANPVITLDGKLDEAVWTKAESLQIAYGVPDGNPGSGWKIMNGSGIPNDPARATLKFLSNKLTNMLYVGVVARDSSVGGAGWEKSDGILGGIFDRKTRAGSQVTLARDIFISWADSPGVATLPNLKGGNLPGAGIVVASASVQGVSNSDDNGSGLRVADGGWTIEFSVSLDSLGYDANSTEIDEIQMTMCIWDADWTQQADFIADRAWWLNEWGNNGGLTAGRILVRTDVNLNTAVLPNYQPDWIVPNGQNYATPIVDGNLSEEVWAQVPSFDIQYGNTTLKASYPTVGPDRSGQWVTTPGNPVVNAGLVKIQMFFQGDKLYLGARVADRSLNSFGGDELFDGVHLNITIPIDSLRDETAHILPNRRFGVAVVPSGSQLLWDGTDWASAISQAITLNPGSTIDNNSDVDAGFSVEMAVDLAKLGYPAGQQNKTVAIGVTYHDYDITPTSTNAYRVWWFREWPGSATPAFCLLDNSAIITGIGGATDAGIVTEFQLYGNFPNPFNPTTKVRFAIPEGGNTSLVVYDLLGRRVSEALFGRLDMGVHEREFNGSSLASGVYYGRVQFNPGNGSPARLSTPVRMVLVK